MLSPPLLGLRPGEARGSWLCLKPWHLDSPVLALAPCSLQLQTQPWRGSSESEVLQVPRRHFFVFHLQKYYMLHAENQRKKNLKITLQIVS